MEGFLPLKHAALWYLAAAPAILYGAHTLTRRFEADPRTRPLIAVAGAFILILSSLKLPSVTGSTSHPTGTGLAVVLLGPAATAVLSLVTLLYQALFLTHGGLTTLGANVFSMGIAGPASGYVIYRATRPLGTTKAVFAATVTADLATYLVTSLQLALAYPATPGGIATAFTAFAGVFAITQIPIALAEAALAAAVFRYVADLRPELLNRLNPRRTPGGRGT